MENKTKKVWTEKERLELAAKLDAGLDDYINQLEKKTYTEGWSEDSWQEEMEKHPFFMKKAPEPGEELSPLMEGLQQLKYGKDYNTPEELANNYKEDGNFNYKHKKYRMAIISYTEGIKTKCENQELIAQLYNNRAASHYMLKNYRSCLNDCKLALKSKPDYSKCLKRAADCCFHIKDFDQCIELCEQMLKLCPSDKAALDLLIDAIKLKKQLQRDKRKQKKRKKNVCMEQQKILSAIESRGIKSISFRNEKVTTWEDMDHPSEDIFPFKVHLDENDRLVWPVMYVYPEVEKTDMIGEFHEDVTILEMLHRLLDEPPEWDTKHQYTANNVKVFCSGITRSSLIPIDVTQSLGDILADKRFGVCCGTVTFIIFPSELLQPEKNHVFQGVLAEMKVRSFVYSLYENYVS